jgi:A/G-specific adenine glycosylase
VVVNEYGGELPKDADRLRKLPGIGRYIAGAIQSIAFDLPAAILEANSARVLCRLFAVRGAIDDGATNRVLWSLAGALVSSERPARHNQAIMELGALVCTPSQPDCGRCPLQALCQANLQGITEKVPVQARRHASVDVTDAAAIVRSRERILIVQRPHLERWGGLWELPRVTVGHGGDPCRVLSDHVQTSLGLEIEVGAEVFALKHTVTHHRITLKCYESRLVRGRPCPRGYEDCRWTVPGRLSEYPSSAPQRKVFGFVQNSADLGSGRRPGGR